MEAIVFIILQIFFAMRAGNINLLLTEREGRAEEYREASRGPYKTTEGQYSPVRLEQARLASSLLYGTRLMLYVLLSNALPVS